MASTYAPVVRRAVASDTQAISTLIDALADYEKLPRPSEEARARLAKDMFGRERPLLEGLLVFLDGYPVGYALYLETYSSFLARPTLYLEDLFVLDEYRGRKAGYALFDAVKAEAIRRGCGRIDWAVLAWNRLAKTFYEKVGGEHLSEWELYRITL